VKHRVKPTLFRANTVKDRAYRVGDATVKQQIKTVICQHMTDLGQKGEYGPAHADVADHGEDIIFFQINGSQRHSQSGEYPFKEEKTPTDSWIYRPQGRQHHRRVRAGNEQIDGAVIQHLQHLLGCAGTHSVVDTGEGVETYHADPVDHGADDSVGVAVEG